MAQGFFIAYTQRTWMILYRRIPAKLSPEKNTAFEFDINAFSVSKKGEDFYRIAKTLTF
jgi:hypothetical protein